MLCSAAADLKHIVCLDFRRHHHNTYQPLDRHSERSKKNSIEKHVIYKQYNNRFAFLF